MKHAEHKLTYALSFQLAADSGGDVGALLRELATAVSQHVEADPDVVFVDAEEGEASGVLQVNLLVQSFEAGLASMHAFVRGPFPALRRAANVTRVFDSRGNELLS